MKINLFIFLITFILFTTACSKKDDALYVQIDDPQLTKKQLLLFFDRTLFTGTILSDFTNGKRKSQQEYLDGKKHGNEVFWYENGQIEVQRTYSYNKKTGIHKAWYQNGSPKFNYTFNADGEYHGNVREWYSSGQLYRDFNYIKGKEQGSQRLWTALGKIKANYDVIDNERYGLIGLKTCKSTSTSKIASK